MNNIRKTCFNAIFFAILILTFGIAGEAGIIQNKSIDIDNKSDLTIQSQFFDAEITFYVWEGEGCACEPIEGAYLFAVGGAGNDSEFTDEDGKCVLTLVINTEYRVKIEAENFHSIIFDIEVIDDQTFHFHMKEDKVSRFNCHSFIHEFILKIINYILL